MSNPMSISLLMTRWICSSDAPSCITTTILPSLLPGGALARPGAARVHGVAFERSSLIDDALKESANGRVVERPRIQLHHVAQDIRLALRRPGRQIQFLLE